MIAWKWVEIDEEDEDKCAAGYVENDNKTLSTEIDLEDEQAEVSTVTFKCIGVKHEQSYQDTLKIACELMMERRY